jgi:hypothetical protein
MLGEQQAKLFSSSCGQQNFTATDGDMKTIVFQGSSPTSSPGHELQAGYQIDLSPGNGRTEAPLLAVAINDATTADLPP